ncbi:MAG: thymidylate synthase [Acidimicrobiia bacterium]|nr:thymidylate synthase [Acidimicrobiia bacterium]MYC58473.1 thymidylate synthase [Acidimicrobiia bacterium]MYG94231.1 thymidylate synthase [Acidimicrobiia bacterium]MYI30421.1 thymidylate synthase [Acidimicrobiia bacterium]
MNPYLAEEFTPAETDILRRYFTNLDKPVFALVNLPEVVKGALFARYSRSTKSLRRLFLDEFVGELDISGDVSIDATVGLRRAEELYDRIFLEYGDDSVAQLGGVHLACEQASNILTKVLEWGRLMSYLEQSTRYVDYLTRIGGRYRYYRDPEVGESTLSGRYVSDMDRMFEAYGELLGVMTKFFQTHISKTPKDADFAYRQAIQAKALDTVRGVLPAATMSNVGMYGTGQSYELLLMRMRSHQLPEVQNYAELMLTELRKVIPSFLKRVDLKDRGVEWSAYMGDVQESMESVVSYLLPEETPSADVPTVQLVDFDPDAEIKMVASMLYPYTHLPSQQLEQEVAAMSVEERVSVMRAYVGDRSNRRHKPGRALERSIYQFDILADYGAFRDLQRHRMLTLEWQKLSPRHGYTQPEALEAAGCAKIFDEVMERSATLYELLNHDFPEQASYVVSLAYKVRFAIGLNARSAMHLIELRTTPQGHPTYREIGQEMWRLIRDKAGHTAVAEMMRFVDLREETPLGRLAAERRTDKLRQLRNALPESIER